MNDKKVFPQIVPEQDRYCCPGPNEIKFISERQTLSVILGSCISTVFIGKNEKYVLAANHIVISEPAPDSIVATKGALEQINEIFSVFEEYYNINRNDLRCFYLIGAGKKIANSRFTVHTRNIIKSTELLKELGYVILLDDTNSYFHATYSISGSNLSIFVEDKLSDRHKSFIIDIDRLFAIDHNKSPFLPASALVANNEGFEDFVNANIVTEVIGKKY